VTAVLGGCAGLLGLDEVAYAPARDGGLAADGAAPDASAADGAGEGAPSDDSPCGLVHADASRLYNFTRGIEGVEHTSNGSLAWQLVADGGTVIIARGDDVDAGDSHVAYLSFPFNEGVRELTVEADFAALGDCAGRLLELTLRHAGSPDDFELRLGRVRGGAVELEQYTREPGDGGPDYFQTRTLSGAQFTEDAWHHLALRVRTEAPASFVGSLDCQGAYAASLPAWVQTPAALTEVRVGIVYNGGPAPACDVRFDAVSVRWR
jgi:hypothetical protein